MPKGKNLGLVLTLGGAPATPHTIVGLPGLYRTSRPTPVGGLGEPTEEQAREADKARGIDLKLVELSDADMDKARKQHQDDLAAFAGKGVANRTAAGQ